MHRLSTTKPGEACPQRSHLAPPTQSPSPTPTRLSRVSNRIETRLWRSDESRLHQQDDNAEPAPHTATTTGKSPGRPRIVLTGCLRVEGDDDGLCTSAQCLCMRTMASVVLDHCDPPSFTLPSSSSARNKLEITVASISILHLHHQTFQAHVPST
ncbi:hypothetical protein BC629DRAFT_1095903 [Irpex lacteus]|nr:hypothetical protein BC629DRAFT_1095903 [Irpex lacteus]